jgi:RecB family exonuclease
VASEARVEAHVEAHVEGTVVTLTARFDRVERGTEGDVIVDYKTGTPPSWPAVESGEKPQLALESWLWQRAERGQVAGAEFWQLKGYGRTPVDVRTRTGAVWQAATAGVEDGVTALAGVFAVPGAQFPALPDRTGGGLVASGVCEYCPLAGVCRRFAGESVMATGPREGHCP